jgi:transposase InsO family protein
VRWGRSSSTTTTPTTPSPPRSPSHTSTPKPSPLLALVALGIVCRLRPAWLAVELKDAARQEHVRAERLSRLVTGAIAAFESALAGLTRRGRPPRRRDDDDAHAELALTRELLAVATARLARAQPRRRDDRDLVVGAWQRLLPLAGMTQQRFCAALALPDRTLRAWLAQPASPPPSPPSPAAAPKTKPKRPPRRRRFGFDVTLPGTQIAADTTDLEVFGVPLKLIAAQDVGGRDASLFDGVLVDDHENADLVVDVLGKALADKPGAQAITDQGTPYLAQKTRDALARLGVEHAPQKEGDPCGKSTIERAFGAVKSIAYPIFFVLNQITRAVPALCDATLAKATATLVLTALLRAYQHGARAARSADAARAGTDSETLMRLAEQTRERARAEDQSRRLLLNNIHALYGLPGSAQVFINTLAKYPLDVLRDAERAFQSQAHREDIRDRKSYFGALVRRAHEQHRLALAREQSFRLDAARLAREQAQRAAQHAAWAADPAGWLRDALGMLALQWDVRSCSLLFDGEGLGLGMATAALRRLFQLHDPRTARDLVGGVLHAFRLAHAARLGPDGVAAVQALVERQRDAVAPLAPTVPVAPLTRPAILSPTGQKPRPPPSARLPTLAA